MVEHTDAYGRGRYVRQLGGGFHRYSTDERWLVRTLKMLYDNACSRAITCQLPADEREFYKRIVTETLDYVVRDMTDSSARLYSTQDADLRRTRGEILRLDARGDRAGLGKEDAALFNLTRM